VATKDSLVLSLNEGVIKRAIDRGAAPATAAASRPAEAGWLGDSMAVKVERKFVDVIFALLREQYQLREQKLAWKAIPILNELRRLRPKEDAVEAYETVFHARLLEPAGGKYVWNAEQLTYESTAYGSPTGPKAGPAMPEAAKMIKSGNFGLSFEDDGLRARVEIERAEK
jgi:hypothetical protein